MKRLSRAAALLCAFGATSLLAAVSTVSFGNFSLETPNGWQKSQSAEDNGTLILGFTQGDDYVTLYAKPGVGVDPTGIFVNGSHVVQSIASETHSGITWKTLTTSKDGDSRAAVYVKGFLTEQGGKTYFGYARSTSESNAAADADVFLNALHYRSWSLTDGSYKGKKYYFGFGAAGDGAPEIMSNEVLYDVRHTHDIFTKDIGGNYLGFTLFEDDATHDSLVQEWNTLQSEMTPDDMYLQYSSGHGNDSMLGVGVTYEEIRDHVLAFPAKEIIVFTMACESGGLVDSFNDRRSDWENFPAQGKSLMVMSSSRDDESSVTGPETDPDEPNGPVGSPGSAFGYSLWKALIGYADGYVDGVKDGYLSLAEIRDYARQSTIDVGGHTPQVTGAYNANLIMNRVPSKAFLESMLTTTLGRSRRDVQALVSRLEMATRVK